MIRMLAPVSQDHHKVDLMAPTAKGAAPDGNARWHDPWSTWHLGQQEGCVAANEPGQDPIGNSSPSRDIRFSSLDARLKAAANAEKARTGTAPRKPEKGYRQGTRVLTELIAGPAGGALLGWVMDRLFGTTPWLLLVMLVLGTVVAFRNIYRISKARPE
jgi:ATP synthase protein I